MDQDPVIAVREMNFFYGVAQVLRDISMDIRPREITALIGPSGCGKSTFLRTLNRMNDQIQDARLTGRVEVLGSDIYCPGADVVGLRKRVGMVFQKATTFPMSIYDNVAYGPKLHGHWDRALLDQHVETCLAQAGLWDEVKDKLRRSAFELSGGQQQRLCIARALAIEPEVLLMDEPTSALDPIATYRIEELLAGLKERYTIVIVTHNMQQAGRVSDKTAFFLLGELIEFGPTADVFTRPTDQRTEDYLNGRFG